MRPGIPPLGLLLVFGGCGQDRNTSVFSPDLNVLKDAEGRWLDPEQVSQADPLYRVARDCGFQTFSVGTDIATKERSLSYDPFEEGAGEKLRCFNDHMQKLKAAK